MHTSISFADIQLKFCVCSNIELVCIVDLDIFKIHPGVGELGDQHLKIAGVCHTVAFYWVLST